MKKSFIVCLLSAVLFNCSHDPTSTNNNQESTLFSLLPASQTGIDFQNPITEGANTNVLMYEYFYNGGGVAVGDLNGDKLDDIYFTANLGANKLYLNRSTPSIGGGKGEIKFEDITAASGAAGREGPWKTGVTMADVNGDGKLDIFVCHSGNLPPEKKVNELFINQGNNAQGIPTFKDETAAYGLAQPTSSTNAYFFDFDRDNDLDLFLLNHNIKSLPVLNESNSAEWIKMDDPISGCRLYENLLNSPLSQARGEVFKDITTKSGINSSPLSYGLGAGIADINQDGWLDIYVSNDYTIPDRLYINQRNSTFKDELQNKLPYTSQFSMGNEVADVNNDGAIDIFTLDMLPEDNRRQKLLMAPDNYEKFDMTVRSGFYKQFMRNMLHLNNTPPPHRGEVGRGVEIAQLAGISNTDWSWAALFADYDNDGWKDLYISNGYLRDYTNLDFLKYMNDFQQTATNVTREDVLNLVNQMPSSNLVNYTFKNNKDLTFKNVANDWGLAQNANSNGAVYSDLDNDGDLDLIVNNINAPAFIYQNQGRKDNHYLKISLQGIEKNTFGIGSKVAIYSKGQMQYLEQMPMRGYQSSVSPTLHFGLGNATVIDSLKIIWQHGKQQTLRQVKADQWLTLQAKDATESPNYSLTTQPLYSQIAGSIDYQQPAVNYNDFKRQLLLVNPQSQVGPCLAKGDINADGLEDVFVGGGNGKASALFVQQKNGSFSRKAQPAFETDTQSDVADASFFDADGDKDLDLYVCHGGYANFEPTDARLQDILYLNDSKGNFSKATNTLPSMPVSTSCVRVADVNNDKIPDLFVGGRVIPDQHPLTPKSFVLIGKQGGANGIQYSVAQTLEIGMVTDAAWIDLNADKKQELVVVGEWMPISVYELSNSQLVDKTDQYFDKKYSGWWNKLLVEDLNGDGRAELIVGNLGLNSQVKASDTEPAELYYKDFDQNGRIDPILCTYIQGKSYPYLTRDELIGQLPMMGKRFPDYKSYADATLTDVFTKDELDGAKQLKANYLKTILLEQDKAGKFIEKALPLQVQFSPIYAIATVDFDKDGKKDLILAGNQLHTRLRFGHYASNQGVLLQNKGNNEFRYVPQSESGFWLNGEVRSIVAINDKLIVGIHAEGVRIYRNK